MGSREQQCFIDEHGNVPKGSHKRKQTSKRQRTGKYAKQRIRTTRNKIVAQQKHLVQHPNDLQAVVNIRKALAKND